MMTLAPMILPALLVGGVTSSNVQAQAPTIQHSALECFPNDQFPQVFATVDSENVIETGRVYFRSDQYPDFYYVEGEFQEDTLQATLPVPSEATARVIYYIEVVDDAYNSSRTEEFGPDVTSGSDCRRKDPGAAWFTGSNPNIVIGATKAGMAAVPPGFQAAGIVGFVTAAGTAAGVGGGIGAGTAVAVGAGAAAAGTVAAVAASSGGSPTTTTTVSGPVAGPPTTSTTTTVPGPSTTTAVTTTPNDYPVSCFETSPDPPVITAGDSVKLDASCAKADRSGGGTDTIKTYEWDLGDGRKKQGRQINPIYRIPGTYTVTLTVTDSGGSTQRVAGSTPWGQNGLQDTFSVEITVEKPPEPVVACFTAVQFGPMGCVEFNASCSTGPIVGYDWIIDEADVLRKITASGKVVTYDWQGRGCSPPVDFGSLGSSWAADAIVGPSTQISVRLTVTSSGGERSVVVNTVNVATMFGPRNTAQILSTSFESFLDTPASQDGPHGYVQMNGAQTNAVSATSVFQHRFDGRSGENRVSAYTTPHAGEGLWRFDFRESENFVPGSIKVKLGQVISLHAYSVVFRVDRPGERVELSYELEPRGR
jgi:PKD repeat protein